MTKQTLAFALLFAIAAGEAVWIGLLMNRPRVTGYWQRVQEDGTYWHSCDGIHYVEVPTADTTTIIQQNDGNQPCSNIVAQSGSVNVECGTDMKGEPKQ